MIGCFLGERRGLNPPKAVEDRGPRTLRPSPRFFGMFEMLANSKPMMNGPLPRAGN